MRALSIHMLARVSDEIGLGHYRRSEVLAHELKRRKHSVLLEKIGTQVSDRAFDVRIVDDPIGAAETVLNQKKTAGKTIALDFYGNPEGVFDLVVAAIDRTPAEVLKKTKVSRLTGLQYFMIDPIFVTSTQSSTKSRNALITFGGKDIKSTTLWLLKNAAPMLETKFDQIRVILDKDHRDHESVEALLKKLDVKTELLGTQDSLLPSLQWASFVFCNGGTTAVQSLLQKRSSLFFVQTPAEIEFLSAIGVSDEIVMQTNDVEQILKKMAKSSDALSNKLKVDVQGVSRIADAIEGIC